MKLDSKPKVLAAGHSDNKSLSTAKLRLGSVGGEEKTFKLIASLAKSSKLPIITQSNAV